MEAVKNQERQGETQFTTKTEVYPAPLNANVFYFFESHPIYYDQTQGSSVDFLTLQIILLNIFNDQTFLQSHMNQLWLYISMDFVVQWAIQLAYDKNIMKSALLKQKSHFFTLLYIYIYIVLSDQVKLYKFI